MSTFPNSLDLPLQVGQISRWNEKGSLGNLYPQPCDRLEGSAGEFFPQDQVQLETEPGVHKYFQDKTSISYFTPDLCRPIHFNFKEETEVMGVSGYKYMLDEGFVANSTFNETNACYNPELDLVVDIPVRKLFLDSCNLPLISSATQSVSATFKFGHK